MDEEVAMFKFGFGQEEEAELVYVRKALRHRTTCPHRQRRVTYGRRSFWPVAVAKQTVAAACSCTFQRLLFDVQAWQLVSARSF